MGKAFDVDDYLVKNGVSLKIKGKEFVVTDIPFGIQEKLKDTTEGAQKETLCEILGCEKADLEGYGLAAVGAIIRHITENLFPESSRKDQ